MFANLLNNDDPLIRYGFAASVVFGSLFFLSQIGLVSVNMARFLAFIAFGWFILRNAKVIASRLA